MDRQTMHCVAVGIRYSVFGIHNLMLCFISFYQSPLGQLFDHGFDCICNLAHISTNSAYLMIGGTAYFSLLQGSLFFAFFMAQWEEYYTGELPHAMGNFGVTEMNYGLGLFAIINSFLDRDAFWSTLMKEVIPDNVVQTIAIIPERILDMEFRHFGLIGWFSIELFLIVGSLYRVLTHERVSKHGNHLSAISKLLTPALIAFSPFLLPKEIMENETRYISICTGLLFSFVTKKMICFSMAKMAFASIQMDAIPYWAVFLWIRYDADITARGANVLLGALCVWYSLRIANWARIAINQICNRLDIHCFTIKAKAVENPNEWKKVR
jgi:ethanolaminephosphotransferase